MQLVQVHPALPQPPIVVVGGLKRLFGVVLRVLKSCSSRVVGVVVLFGSDKRSRQAADDFIGARGRCAFCAVPKGSTAAAPP